MFGMSIELVETVNQTWNEKSFGNIMANNLPVHQHHLNRLSIIEFVLKNLARRNSIYCIWQLVLQFILWFLVHICLGFIQLAMEWLAQHQMEMDKTNCFAVFLYRIPWTNHIHVEFQLSLLWIWIWLWFVLIKY